MLYYVLLHRVVLCNVVCRVQSGIAKFQLSRQVVQDEVYYFSNAVNLQKAVVGGRGEG